MQPDFEAIKPARVEFEGFRPYSPTFGDGYFGSADSEGESAAVFLEGNRLAQRFADLGPDDFFVIGEVGFGTGLNALQAARLFEQVAPAGARLILISAEKHPLTAADLDRALDAWPALRPWSRALRSGYPAPTPGFHRIILGTGVELLLMFGDAEIMWQCQAARVDAWFLDGFAPARNPESWSGSLVSLLARRSRPGTTLATFSAAGSVRRALADCGFEVRRRDGFGGKRHRLEASLDGKWRARASRRGRVRIAGAGLAGATTARALAERGWSVEVWDPGGVAGGASGNRSGVVYTTPSGVATPQNRFYQSSYLCALRWLSAQRAEGRGLATMDGVVQHVTGERQRRKLVSAGESGVWPESLLSWLDDDSVLLPGAGVVAPQAWCRHLLDDNRIELRTQALESIEQARRGVDAVVVCTAGANLRDLPELPIRSIRGQVTECAATSASRSWRRAHCHDGYVTPSIDGIHSVGATFDLHETTPEARDGDDRRNLEELRRWLPEHWRDLGAEEIGIVGHRVGFRCQTPDFLPIAGPIEIAGAADPPVWLNLAHGSRGLSGTPLTAERIADDLTGLPSAIDSNMVRALDPDRFLSRPTTPRSLRAAAHRAGPRRGHRRSGPR